MIKLNAHRTCCICGMKLFFMGYVHKGVDSGITSKIGMELFKEIWKNDIFILKCCRCFAPYIKRN